jgi:transcription antitermination factor NusG
MEYDRWYVAYTPPRHEKRVFENLRLREIESFLPTYTKVHRWSNRTNAKVELPIFPGYVFVRIKLRDKSSVLCTPSVVNMVSFAGRPSSIPDADVEALRIGVEKLQAEPHPFLKIGQRVRVRRGPLSGMEGILVQKKDDCRFVLSMDLIAKSVSVKIDSSDVEST